MFTHTPKELGHGLNVRLCKSHEIFIFSLDFPYYSWDILVELRFFNTSTMSSSCGKKTAVPASKKRKGVASSSGPTTEIRHPFLQVPLGPQEELYQILRARPLGVGRCID
ncbi:hypothetical protein GOBAR_AA22628 [Gossypium barbadense]|uniref:Uncharacterized protein n=1 Tax=Gossypium barbadense TaxID=3634 RepID=A0A2P5X400_GOSBA|nr:hypothetical protein GOBAR_AA22628 [Gossypium barbadense]